MCCYRTCIWVSSVLKSAAFKTDSSYSKECNHVNNFSPSFKMQCLAGLMPEALKPNA